MWFKPNVKAVGFHRNVMKTKPETFRVAQKGDLNQSWNRSGFTKSLNQNSKCEKQDHEP